MAEENNKSDIARREEEILKFWQENKIFEKTLTKDAPSGEFVFYDGPPFATGLPHYGHILAGTIKDAIPRYKTMKGHFVRRQWGWDCHGLPLENEVEKELNFKSKKDIEDYGIEPFNETAKKFVLRYADDWERIIPRLGRWVDMASPYKTMDASYTESVFWIFKKLYEKDLAYRGFKSMHLCLRCETTLSNFEVNQSYKELTDFAVTVKLQLKDDPTVSLLIWTTTAWTLPGNIAAAVNPEIDYALAELPNKEKYILSKDKVASILGEEAVIVKEMKGHDLIGKEYIPPFDYYFSKSFEKKENAWKVYGASFVTTEAGTGIVHLAPAFGADDLDIARENNIPIVHHVDLTGKFTSDVTDFAGTPVKSAEDNMGTDLLIIKHLSHANKLFAKEKIKHSYPVCWRCDTPLINYATSSWFVSVSKIKDQLLTENSKIKWVPEEIGENRFGKWLEGARDWAISRSRYWGAPLPVWVSEDDTKHIVIGSLEELKSKTTRNNTFIVVRHGEAEHNAKNIANSNPAVVFHLTEKGKEQVKKLSENLKDRDISKIYTSPFMRSKETANLLSGEINYRGEVVEDNRLRELNFGDLDNKDFNEFRMHMEKQNYAYDIPLPNGESYLDAKRRFGDFLYDINNKHQNETIVIVSHGVAIESIKAIIEGADNERSKELLSEDMELASVFEFKFAPIPHNRNYELDFHRPYIDEIMWDEDGVLLKRVPEVFDCWFESGAMPYGQYHYPFQNKDKFDAETGINFPADFIAEGLDQTRGWFYTLLILGVALFEKSPYKNVIVNGLVLAEDGQKMSKRLKNYPDPIEVVSKYGADALRYYLLSSPVVRSEDLNFSENGVAEVVKKLILRLHNSYTFLEMYGGENISGEVNSSNILDKWIIARLKETTVEVSEAMEKYELDRAVRPLGRFIDDLSTWFVRRSRDRFKEEGADKRNAVSTTYFVLAEFSKIMAPFMPFIADDIYKKVTNNESVHLATWPAMPILAEEEKQIIDLMEETRKLSSLGLESRSRANMKVRQPLSELKVKSLKLKGLDEYLEIIKDEVNIKNISFDENLSEDVELSIEITPELKKEGMARDFLRLVQDLRKNKGLLPRDSAVLLVNDSPEVRDFISFSNDLIKNVAGISEIKFVPTLTSEPLRIEDITLQIDLEK
jgi:isoleucyl-tRNA synthetase